jgi:serine/threonine protein phosphatase PrpC
VIVLMRIGDGFGIWRMQRQLRRHVQDHVAMKQPIARAVGNPSHVKRMPRINAFGHGFTSLRFGIVDKPDAVSHTVYGEEKAM